MLDQDHKLNVRKVTLGHIAQEEVIAADMPRSVFIELVLKCAKYTPEPEDLLAVVMPVALRMDRFPLGAWVHTTRGCGCIIGEMLVAGDLMRREELTKRFRAWIDLDGPQVDIIAELEAEHGSHLARQLKIFGEAIDGDIGDWVGDRTDSDSLWFGGRNKLSRVVMITDGGAS